MKEIIKVIQKDGKQLVSARELHGYLEVKTGLVLWMQRMLDYGFEEAIDYTISKSENPVNQRVGITDYALTLDTAKEISMLQRTSKGSEARKYFIECENSLKSATVDFTNPQVILQLAQNYADKCAELEESNAQVAEMEPKVEVLHQITDTTDLLTFSEAVKILDLGFGRNKLFAKLREMGILFKTRNEPMQHYVDRGYFKVKERLIKVSGWSDKVKNTTYVTQKGLQYLFKIFKQESKPQAS